ncbi:hypothetical protein PFISCL1PPCAC_28882, partial [Pristionchus fissidentatus]
LKMAENEKERIRITEKHDATIEEIVGEEKRRIELMNRIKHERDEERKRQWKEMFQRFVSSLQYNTSNAEYEAKWDNR